MRVRKTVLIYWVVLAVIVFGLWAVYGGDREPALVEIEHSTSNRGRAIYRLHNYEYRVVECFISGDNGFFDSLVIKARKPSGWAYTPRGLHWECY